MRLTTLLCLLMTVPAVALAGSTPAEGQPAPDFRLQDQNDKWHTLADYQGQWVALYFYPKADTPGCTTEACNFRDDIFKFKATHGTVWIPARTRHRSSPPSSR